MFIVIRALIWVIVFWRWGDWRNWKKYQASILFFILGDILYNFLCYNYPMWQYKANGLLPNHTESTLFVAFVIYPCAVILYLGYYPTSYIKQVLWVLLWVVSWTFCEWVDTLFGLLTYHHGWNLWWSALFMLVAVSIVRLHHNKPLWAYVISVFIVPLLLWKFHVPILK